MASKRRPGEIRDAILEVLAAKPDGATLIDIQHSVVERLGSASASSVRSYLRLNTPTLFERSQRGHYLLREKMVETSQATSHAAPEEVFTYDRATLVLSDCFDWLRGRERNSVHAVVTDPPYGLFEYTDEQQLKLRNGKGGVWRIPQSFDGAKRAPLPRFTVLTERDLRTLEEFFHRWARLLMPVLVPGANVLIATNPLLSYVVSGAVARAGLERRGEIVRLVMTMRGGDRPKAAHTEFSEVSVMPRSMWEPWLVFRRPVEGRVQDNLRRWHTGGFRRPTRDRPFGDVIRSSPTPKRERTLAAHPSLKPQAFLRHIVRAVLPLGEGMILDPFAGAGSTLAAAAALGYESIGIEKDPVYYRTARAAIPPLASLRITTTETTDGRSSSL